MNREQFLTVSYLLTINKQFKYGVILHNHRIMVNQEDFEEVQTASAHISSGVRFRLKVLDKPVTAEYKRLHSYYIFQLELTVLL